MNNTKRTRHLLKQYAAGDASLEEEKELFDRLRIQSGEEIESYLLELLGEEKPEPVDPKIWQPVIERITNGDERSKVIPIHRWLAAAAIAGFLLLSGYWLFMKSSNTRLPGISQVQKVMDVPPGKEGAILTLGSGTKILMDTLTDGSPVTLLGGKVKKQQSELQYDAQQIAGPREAEINMLTTPRGRTFAVVLADGTRVWLNSASSIRYPVAFTGEAREVTIAGEAYFEVAKDPDKKFKVYFALPGADKPGVVEVLGTHFNVSSYSDEENVKISLIEGSVRVSANDNEKLTTSATLLPGQQATLRLGESRVTTSGFDEESVLAWKDGFFQFDNAEISVILRQLARWYNIEVKTEGDLKRKLGGRITRNQPLSSMLKVFDAKKIKYKFEGNQLLVLP